MNAIDLFAGLGGWSTGAVQAGCNVLWAANHNPDAVTWHEANHPETVHVCQDLHQANWLEVPSHDLMLASPCCHGHSKARGKDRPQHDVSRSTAWAVVSAAECHRPPIILVENVPEFLEWNLYPAWGQAMSALGYAIAPYEVDVADLGVPQHRTRLIIVLSQSKAPLELKAQRRLHVPVRDIIDWDKGNWSPVEKPGRSQKTLERVARGRQAFGDRFVMPYYSSGSGLTGRSLDRPIGTITTKSRWGIVDGDRMRMLSVDEARKAMSFPDHTKLPPQGYIANQLLGNAVPPGAAEAFITAVKEAA